MALKRILINTIWYGIIPKLPVLLSIFALPLITPFLTAEDYGLMGKISAYTAIAAGLCTFGLHVHLANTFFERPNDYKIVWNQLLSLMFIISFICATILYFILYTSLSLSLGVYNFFILLLVVVPVALTPNQLIANNYYLLINKPAVQILRNLIASIVAFFVMIYLIVILKMGYVGWILSTFSAALISFFLFIKPLWIVEKVHPSFISLNRCELKYLFLISLPIIPHNLGHIMMSSSDRVIMDLYGVSNKEMGVYYNGYQIAEYMNIFLLALCTATSPLVQKSYRDNDNNKTLWYFLTTSLIAYILICLGSLWMREFYSIFVKNNELQPAAEIAVLSIFSYFPVILYFFLSTYVFISKKTNHILFLVFVPAILNIILNIVFIPVYGYVAAIYTTLISYWVVFLVPFVVPFYKKTFEEMIGPINLLLYLMVLYLFSLLVIVLFNELLWFKISYTILLIFLVFYKRKFLFSKFL